MAVNSPDLEVVGLTTVGGNASLADTTRNALALLAAAGRPDIPVWRGADRALDGGFTYAYEFHGEQGMGVKLAPAAAAIRPGPAADAIIAAARARPGELSVLALGPLTNVAAALRQHPGLAGEVAEILVMGGALEAPGNVTAHAEFNIYNDPAAAAIVFGSGAKVSMVGLDVTTMVAIARSSDPWRAQPSMTASLAGRILEHWLTTHPGFDRYNLHDPLTVAAAIEPGLLAWRSGRIGVDAGDGPERGRTTLTDGEGPVRGAVGVDSDRARELIEDLVGRRG